MADPARRGISRADPRHSGSRSPNDHSIRMHPINRIGTDRAAPPAPSPIRYELGRQPANTKLSSHVDVRVVRCRGGNKKFRALRLDHGNFSWGSENVTRKARILDVCYNASNNELVRTKTLVKGAVIAIDASEFRSWYQQHYGKKIGIKVKDGVKVESEDIDEKRSKSLARKLNKRNKGHTVAPNIDASSPPAASTRSSPPALASAAGATATSSRVRSSTSTSRRCRRRRASTPTPPPRNLFAAKWSCGGSTFECFRD